MEINKSGYHTTVLLHETVEGLNIQPDGVYVDATFGGGGHSRLILEKLSEKGRLIAFDQDKDAWENLPDDPRIIPVKENFKWIKRFLRFYQYPKVNGVLADLGVSSFQFDTGERGFSTRFSGPLDMRMDKRSPTTAATILNNYSEKALVDILSRYGEVRNSKQLARLIVEERKSTEFKTIDQFKSILEKFSFGNPNKYLAQVFQAVRIEVNQEMEVLKDFLTQAADALETGGRLSVITFHSLEDRIVKQFFKKGPEGKEEIENPFGTLSNKIVKEINNKPITASEEELKKNNRSRSAKLRIAEKI